MNVYIPPSLPPRRRHACDLGSASTFREGTLTRCGVCRRWYRNVESHIFWTEHTWRPVRWWHFADQRRISVWIKS